MTSPLKVKLSHRRDKVQRKRGRVKGEESVEITSQSLQLVRRHVQWVHHH